MKTTSRFFNITSIALAFAAVVSLIVAQFATRMPGGTEKTAAVVQKSLERRMRSLEDYAEHPGKSLPSDMVIYTYLNDSLVAWRGQFPVANDNISHVPAYSVVPSTGRNSGSPLADVGENASFYNFKDSWYVAEKIHSGRYLNIVGLWISDDASADSGRGAVNRHIAIRDKYSVQPLQAGGGSVVKLDGVPVFKVFYDSMTADTEVKELFIWVAYILLLSSLLAFLLSRRDFTAFLVCLSLMSLFTLAMFLWSSAESGWNPVFVLVNLFITSFSLYFLLAHDAVDEKMAFIPETVRKNVLLPLALVAILVYTHFSLKSIILNYGISLEIYRIGELTRYSAEVLVSYLLMLTSIPMILRMRFGSIGIWKSVSLSLAVALYLVLTASVLGLQREKFRAETLAGRLAIDRDDEVERNLCRVEGLIAEDFSIRSMVLGTKDMQAVKKNICDNYLPSIGRYYDVAVLSGTDVLRDFVTDILSSGTRIADNSRFVYSDSDTGPRYVGEFVYSDSVSTAHVALLLERKFGASLSRQVAVPPQYSYARYTGGKIKAFRGSYAYPTVWDEDVFQSSDSEGYVHFINNVGEKDVVVLSRHRLSVMNYVVAVVFVAILFFLLMTPLNVRKEQERIPGRHYYKTRITWVVMISILLTLVSMATVSVTFMYKVINDTMETLMSEKIGALQSMIQNSLRGVRDADDLYAPEVSAALETVAADNNAYLSLYSSDGRLVKSNVNESRMKGLAAGYRVDETAYDRIMHHHVSYFIQRETRGLRWVYHMYAPIFGRGGQTIAILRSPYTGVETYEQERNAAMHLVTIITLLIVLLTLSSFVIGKILARMFNPLNEMGNRMSNAGLSPMEHIEYHLNDEVAYLVEAYNRMVDQLRENSKQLVQAERNGAWSSMARQVAHEIKNPLTPMKLQIQSLIRMKSKGDPRWIDKFDEVSRVLLDHVDILSDTANEFSSFAKLYTEEPVDINLDEVLKEELAMFAGREDISFEYLGLQGAVVTGPKPQLTRVFVNLINNAVQAVDECPPENRRILVSLRKSSDYGNYDIVVEDSGPGVPAENMDKLFSPNFTTKNGGSGLGLAISKSVLDTCGATISYQKSFHLGGACFIVRYPAKIPA